MASRVIATRFFYEYLFVMQYSPFVINTISQKVVRKHAKSSKKTRKK